MRRDGSRRRQRLEATPPWASMSDRDWAVLAMFLAEYPAAGLALAPTLRLLGLDRAPDADQPAAPGAAG